MGVQKVAIQPTYIKDNGLWALDTQHLVPTEAFQPADQAIISLPAQQVAGNHRHERKEALLGIGSGAYFVWQDETGQTHEEAMNPDGQLNMFLIPSNVPHAVINKSKTDSIILYEYFDDVFRSIEKVELVHPLDGSK